ncbi:uncharacterized protein HMPREF1541_00959 [Cyphellophora europaea CBS 101466]|uniref:AA9 family lytic polysaccharide monooxygenase n=1 Tax=Cyphellophora europaea (strain CBS 101466) TaxID=1220924 RepID=W2SDR8_CYPE1|nr:uncharacterized protein HMPREF1541_00959 [Cyphellophora europaea CBS 101466]ETN46770.1 hypothetical protein HMPREF1541_00959 [Cyphellophora europaea CBS 101466]
MAAMKINSIVGALAFASTVYAHGHVKSYTIGGQEVEGGVNGGLGRSPRPDTAAWVADNLDNGFVSDPTSPDIVCHKGGEPGTSSVTVAAGDTITMNWDTWPESHSGPVIDYLASAGSDFAGVSKSSLQFVKIAEAGLSGGSWAANELIANGNTWPVTIPSSIAPGNYVLRHEIIALHEGGNPGGAQFYPQCVNIEVTGSGSDSLSSGTVGTQLYTANDPGVLFNMYNNPTSYPIPGPPLMAGGGSGSNPGSGGNGGSGGSGTTNLPAPAPTTTLQTSTVPAATPTTTTPANGGSGTVAQYQQCGGQEFTGPTTCQSGLTCTELNPYYFQCL